MRSVISLLGDTIFPAICLVGIGYNTLVMLNSPEGVRMKNILEQQIADEQARLAELQEEHAYLSNRADRLLSSSLDKDLLEERVRSVLGLVDQGEYFVRMDQLDRLAGAEVVAPTIQDATDKDVRFAALER